MTPLPTTENESQGFNGLTVAAFESRMASEMENLITRQGGVPRVAPSMREVPLEDHRDAFAFFERLLERPLDVMVFMTGVGTRTLFQALETKYPKSLIQKAFKRIRLAARGPKAVKALSEWELKSSAKVAEPNTWKEVLASLGDLEGKKVAVQEYGVSNPEFLQGLKDLGAGEVLSVPVYRWALPEDRAPLEGLLESILEGQVSVALFTSAQQIHHVFEVARGLGREAEAREALGRIVIGSVGSVCSESIRKFGLSVDLEPEHPKMGHLVKEAAEKCFELCQMKMAAALQAAPRPARPPAAPESREGLFLKACRRETASQTPLWIMRQAGRYLPEYRAIRSKVPFLELCKTPELACEVTVKAQEVLGVDAAILFADILLISEPLGFQLSFAESEGPVLNNPFRGEADLKRLRPVDGAEDLSYVMKAVRLIRKSLQPGIPLIGFAGAPFTLASYLIEGGGSKDYFHTRSLLGDKPLWDALMRRLVEATASYLNAQAEAGAQALQLFDSWVGILSPGEFRRLVLPYLKLLVGALKPGVPVIYFGTQTAPFFPWLRETGASVVGVDWRTDLDKAWKQLGEVAVQGNLNPEVLLSDPDAVRAETERILRLAGGRPGHIFNLGHGILPATPMDNVRAMIETVKNWKNA
jgi:uroporphyrinogen decarboxylase